MAVTYSCYFVLLVVKFPIVIFPRGGRHCFLFFSKSRFGLSRSNISRRTATNVHMLAGGAKPFLLAPGGEMRVEGLEGVRSVSQFGGDCYVHGLMDGTAGAGHWEEIYLV